MAAQIELAIGEHLEVVSKDGERRFRCSRCEHDLGGVRENYKLSTRVREVAVEEVNPLAVPPSRFIDDPMVLRQYFCPGCMRLLDNEINRAGQPPLWDIELR